MKLGEIKLVLSNKMDVLDLFFFNVLGVISERAKSCGAHPALNAHYAKCHFTAGCWVSNSGGASAGGADWNTWFQASSDKVVLISWSFNTVTAAELLVLAF